MPLLRECTHWTIWRFSLHPQAQSLGSSTAATSPGGQRKAALCPPEGVAGQLFPGRGKHGELLPRDAMWLTVIRPGWELACSKIA